MALNGHIRQSRLPDPTLHETTKRSLRSGWTGNSLAEILKVREETYSAQHPPPFASRTVSGVLPARVR